MIKHSAMFYFHPEGFETKELHGKSMYRDASMALGTWRPLPRPIDRLFDHIQVLTGAPSRRFLVSVLEIDSASLSRSRRGEMKEIPMNWLVRMCDYTGLSLEQIRAIGGIKPWCKRWNEKG